MKNACSNLNKVISIKENYSENANNLEAGNKDTDFYLLSNKNIIFISREKPNSRYKGSPFRIRALLRTYRSHLTN
jgi:hypothetical protein